MSSQRGNASRTRKQKHPNAIVFKNNKHGDTPKTKILNSLQVMSLFTLKYELFLVYFYWKRFAMYVLTAKLYLNGKSSTTNTRC